MSRPQLAFACLCLAVSSLSVQPVQGQVTVAGYVASSCQPPAAFLLGPVGAQMMAFKLGVSGNPDPLFHQALNGGSVTGGLSLNDYTYVVPANWRDTHHANDILVTYVTAPGAVAIDSGLMSAGSNMGATLVQVVGATAGEAFPSLQGTPFGYELEFAPLIELDSRFLSTACTLAGDSLGGARFILGYDVYRLPRAAYPSPSLRDFFDEGFLAHASVLGLDMNIPDDTGFGCSDLDSSDQVRVRNPDGLPDSGDEVLVFSDTSRSPSGLLRPDAADPERDYWYRVQPVVDGNVAYFESGGTVSSEKLSVTTWDTDGDGQSDGVDVLGDGFPEFLSHSGVGLGMTHGGEILSSPEPGLAIGQAPASDGDADGLSDALELSLGLDPTRSNLGQDSDGDHVDDFLEVEVGSDPTQADGDLGGEDDARELFYGRSPRNPCDDVTIEMLGDVTPTAGGDGRVSVTDVVRLLRFAVALQEPTPWELTVGDVTPAELVDDSGVPDLRRRHGLEEPGGGYSFGRYGHGDGVINVTDVVLGLRASVGLSVIVDELP